MRRSSYKQIKDKQQKQRSIKLAIEAVRKLRKPKLHDNTPKEVTTQQASPSPRPQRPRVFTWSLIAERVATTMLSRESRHPQTLLSLAPKRWDFSQKNFHHNRYVSKLANPELSFYHAIWVLTTPRRR
jgi:hypothetical protein